MLLLRDILGQERAVRILRTALTEGRTHHAWIFYGPEGVGKFTTAKAFAAALLDPGAAVDLAGQFDADPDGVTVKQITNGAHADFHVITKELAESSSNPEIRKRKQIVIPLAVIQEFLIERAALSGHGERSDAARASKVFIVDEAELLADQAQNTMLKTLEEPPPGTVIILVTSKEHRLLPTIRSRCQRVGFTPLSEADLQSWLDRFRQQSAIDVDLDDERLAWLLRFADGSPGLAGLALEHDLMAWREAIIPRLRSLWTGSFPTDLGGTMAKLVDDFASGWVKERPKASKDAANKMASRLMFHLLGVELRASLVTTCTTGRAPDRIFRMIDLLQEAERQLQSNLHKGMVFENLAIQFAGTDAPAVPAVFATETL